MHGEEVYLTWARGGDGLLLLDTDGTVRCGTSPLLSLVRSYCRCYRFCTRKLARPQIRAIAPRPLPSLHSPQLQTDGSARARAQRANPPLLRTKEYVTPIHLAGSLTPSRPSQHQQLHARHLSWNRSLSDRRAGTPCLAFPELESIRGAGRTSGMRRAEERQCARDGEFSKTRQDSDRH